MARERAFAAAVLGLCLWPFSFFQAGAEQRGCPFGVPHSSGYCHAPLPRDACMKFPGTCTPHAFKVGGVEYCQYKQLPCDGKPDAKQSEDKADRFAVGIGKCDQAVAAGKRCKWDGLNCYEQTSGRYGQEMFERVDFAQCRGESVQAFLDACAFWIRRGHVTTNCPTRERLAQSPYDGAKPHAAAILPAPEKTAAPPQPPTPARCPLAIGEYTQVLAQRRDREIFKGSDHMKKADEAFEDMSRRISANPECRRLCNQDSACAPWLEMVVRLIDEKEGTCVAVERMLAPSDAVILLSSAEVLRRCKRHIEGGPSQTRAPAPPPAEVTCASWHPAAQVDETANYDQRQGRGTCSIRNLTAQQCTSIGGTHFKPDHGSGFTECFRFVGPGAPATSAPKVNVPEPTVRTPTPTVNAPDLRAPAVPTPTVRAPTMPAPSVRAPTPTINAPTPREAAPAKPACPAGFVSTMRLGIEWCGSYALTEGSCRQAGGSIVKDLTAAGGGRNLCLVRLDAASAPGAPAARAPTTPAVKAPEVRAPTTPGTAAPRTPAPTQPNTVMSGMTPRCQQLVTNYVTAARAKDGPRALAGYQALKAAGGCGVLHKVDRPQPRVRAPAQADSRFISRGATPNTDQVVGACDASPAECAARVRQLQAGTSDAAKAALYSHAFSVGWQLGTIVGSGALMAVPPSAPRTASPTTAAPGVRNTYGQGSPLNPAPRTRQSDITGTK